MVESFDFCFFSLFSLVGKKERRKERKGRRKETIRVMNIEIYSLVFVHTQLWDIAKSIVCVYSSDCFAMKLKFAVMENWLRLMGESQSGSRSAITSFGGSDNCVKSWLSMGSVVNGTSSRSSSSSSTVTSMRIRMKSNLISCFTKHFMRLNTRTVPTLKSTLSWFYRYLKAFPLFLQ